MKQVIGGMVRTGLAALGGWLVSKGYASAEDAGSIASNADALVGVGTVLITAAWSYVAKRVAK